MIDLKYRQLMLDSPASVRASTLSDHEIELVKFVKRRGEVRSPDVADEFRISLQNASIRLSALVTAGYLRRQLDPYQLKKVYVYWVEEGLK